MSQSNLEEEKKTIQTLSVIQKQRIKARILPNASYQRAGSAGRVRNSGDPREILAHLKMNRKRELELKIIQEDHDSVEEEDSWHLQSKKANISKQSLGEKDIVSLKSLRELKVVGSDGCRFTINQCIRACKREVKKIKRSSQEEPGLISGSAFFGRLTSQRSVRVIQYRP